MTAEQGSPTGLTFHPLCDELDVSAVRWVKVPDDYPCSDCKQRGGWRPQVWQPDCPMCWGSDPYGQGSYCGQCEYCCGC